MGQGFSPIWRVIYLMELRLIMKTNLWVVDSKLTILMRNHRVVAVNRLRDFSNH